MADSQATTGLDTPEEKLDRLSKKAGVIASIIIDRESGSILKTSGNISALTTAKSRNASTTATFANEDPASEEAESQGVEDFAQKIWNYVNGSGQLVQEMDTEDELRLLRLRTKKQEIVIVPDSKYILTVIHDTHQT